jgi:trimethylamine--corrinoid protein Co-methyltransferase
MRTATLAIGSPEFSLLTNAHAQMARTYGLPCKAGGALTDSNSPDVQAGVESMLGLLTAVNSGVDLIVHAAGILSSFKAFSYEKLVLDDEICGMVRCYQRGIQVNPDTLAYDLIAQVGPGGNYLTEKHTLERCRTAFWVPVVFDRKGLEAWMAGGQPRAIDRVRERWQGLLAEHRDPPLDETIARQLQGYVEDNVL